MAMIEFSCPSCNAQYRVPEKAGGKQATCKSCGATIAVPGKRKSSSGGSKGSSGSSRNVDLSGLYNSAEAGGAGPVVAPPMDGGSIFATSTPRRSGPSPALLIGIGGGVVILILSVVLIVVLMGGGGDSKSDPTAGAGPAVVTPGPSRSRTRGSSRAGTSSNPDTTPDDESDPGETPPERTPITPAAQGQLIAPPDAELTGVVDWTLAVPEKVAAYAERVEVRGIVLSFPPDWASKSTSTDTWLGGESEFREMMIQGLGRGILEVTIMNVSPGDGSSDVEFMITVARSTQEETWPTFRFIDALGPETFGMSQDDMDDLMEDDYAHLAHETAANLGMIQVMELMFDPTSVAFNFYKPESYYVKEGSYESVEYGTLFGGHPFARVVLENESEGTTTLFYAGKVGDMQVTMMAGIPDQSADLLADMDWVVRSARLMTPTQAREYARGDTVYAAWMDDSFMDIAYAGDNVPHAGLEKPGWDGFGEGSLFRNAAAASLVTPYRQPYGLIAPEGLRLATTNRLAARWVPDVNGLWLQLRVTKLEGREQRTMASPILPAAGETPERLFIYSTPADLPAGYEHSEVQADGLTLHRVLLPAVQGQRMRKVYYIYFDGPDQVTIEGHFDANRPDDLERLDAAAATLTKT